MQQPYYPRVSTLSAALRCRCPRCGEGRLFKGLLDLRAHCERCQLDYAKVDTGDGPAVFVIFLIGPLVVGLALWLELKVEPPLWLHALLWLPLAVGGSLALIRPMKAFLIAQQYRHAVIQGFGG